MGWTTKNVAATVAPINLRFALHADTKCRWKLILKSSRQKVSFDPRVRGLRFRLAFRRMVLLSFSRYNRAVGTGPGRSFVFVTDESVAQPGPGPVANWKVRTSVDVDPGKNPRVRVSPGRLQDHWAYPGCARFV